jgi:hypothetical protein
MREMAGDFIFQQRNEGNGGKYLVIETFHHLCLAEEVNLLLEGAAHLQGLHSHRNLSQ